MLHTLDSKTLFETFLTNILNPYHNHHIYNLFSNRITFSFFNTEVFNFYSQQWWITRIHLTLLPMTLAMLSWLMLKLLQPKMEAWIRETLLKGKAQYSWPPWHSQFISGAFDFENIIYFLYETRYFNEEVNCTEPSPSVSVPCLDLKIKQTQLPDNAKDVITANEFLKRINEMMGANNWKEKVAYHTFALSLWYSVNTWLTSILRKPRMTKRCRLPWSFVWGWIVRSFIQLCHFFKYFAIIAVPFFKLTWKDSDYKSCRMPPDALQAHLHQKQLTSEPVIAFSKADKTYYTFIMDASTGTADNTGGLGVIITQVEELENHLAISFASAKFKDYEKNFSRYLLQAAAAVWGMDVFKVYAGEKAILFTRRILFEKNGYLLSTGFSLLLWSMALWFSTEKPPTSLLTIYCSCLHFKLLPWKILFQFLIFSNRI